MQLHHLALLATALAFPSCAKQAPDGAPTAPPPTPVAVVTIAPHDVPMRFEYLGRTEGSREIEIRARISGFLDKRHFVEGTDVAAGDLLFELDARTLLAQEQTSKAELAAAEARLSQAKREEARLQPLVAEEAVSQREYDDATSATRIATAELAAATARLNQTGVDLEYTRVTAPIAGRIGRALKPEGSLVSPTADGLLTTLLQLDPIYVTFQRTENQQRRLDRDLQSGRLALAPGSKFTVQIQHRDGSVLASGGAIDFSAGQLDTSTGTILMRATLPNPQHQVLAGQSVKVVLSGAVLAQAITVPQRAVVENPEGKVVMLAVTGADGKTVVTPRQIEVAEWVDLPGSGPASHSWVVDKGLAAGDRVIIDNLMHVRAGSPVQATEMQTAKTETKTETPSEGR